MSEDQPIDHLTLNVFDTFGTAGFKERLDAAQARIEALHGDGRFAKVRIVPHTMVYDLAGLFRYEEEKVGLGAEGVMVRDPLGKYKHGKSTLKEGGLAAVKRMTQAEAVVTGCFEQEENQDAKVVNALGYAKRSSARPARLGKTHSAAFTS
jgi:DNA ligase-1